jgi:hypothetical protein
MTDAQIEVPSDTCPNCQRKMDVGELVTMDWAGQAIAHIVCARDSQADPQ